MDRPITDLHLGTASLIQEAISCIDRSGRVSIALVVDGQGRLVDVITDGDIRRALIHGLGMESPVSELLRIKTQTPHPRAVTAAAGTDTAVLLKMMQEQSVRQVPLVDGEGRVTDIVILSDLMPQQTTPLRAVIMAGGFGKRLHPLTEDTPKPMLHVGNRPIMEVIIDQLRQAEVSRLHVSTHYKPEKIREYFGDGKDFGMQIDYLYEDSPLGTAGALGLMPVSDSPILVINGDILTQVNYRIMLCFHRQHAADMTVAVRRYDFQVPYGIVECEGPLVKGVKEKPTFSFFVNAGIYVIEPSVVGLVPRGRKFDMTDLIQKLTEEKRTVVSFPIVEYWLDIGKHNDYQQAQEDIKSGKIQC